MTVANLPLSLKMKEFGKHLAKLRHEYTAVAPFMRHSAWPVVGLFGATMCVIMN